MWGSTVPCTAQNHLQLIQNNGVTAIVGAKKFDESRVDFLSTWHFENHDQTESGKNNV